MMVSSDLELKDALHHVRCDILAMVHGMIAVMREQGVGEEILTGFDHMLEYILCRIENI